MEEFIWMKRDKLSVSRLRRSEKGYQKDSPNLPTKAKAFHLIHPVRPVSFQCLPVSLEKFVKKKCPSVVS